MVKSTLAQVYFSAEGVMKLGRFCLLLFSGILLMVSGVLFAGHQRSLPSTTITRAAYPDMDDYAEWGLPETGGVPTLNPAGSMDTVASAFPAVKIQPMSWSPDGSRIAYQVRYNRESTIFITQPDGSQPQELTTDAFFNGYPCWSPDGRWIAYISVRDKVASVYKIRPDGTDRRLVVTNVHRYSMPHWSPDGRWIAAVVFRGGNWDIYRAHTDGSVLDRLTFNPEFDSLPIWSPDGRWIAYVSRSESIWRLYRMSVNGNQRQPLARVRSAGHPPFSWSPDGQWIAYESQSGNIFRIRHNGTSLQQLTHSDTREQYPRWSPDGEWIAFVSASQNGMSTFYKMRPDGSRQQELPIVSMGSPPLWSPELHSTGDGAWQGLLVALLIVVACVIVRRRKKGTKVIARIRQIDEQLST